MGFLRIRRTFLELGVFAHQLFETVVAERDDLSLIDLIEAMECVDFSIMMWTDGEERVVSVEGSFPVYHLGTDDGVKEIDVLDFVHGPLEKELVEIRERHQENFAVDGLEEHRPCEAVAYIEGVEVLVLPVECAIVSARCEIHDRSIAILEEFENESFEIDPVVRGLCVEDDLEAGMHRSFGDLQARKLGTDMAMIAALREEAFDEIQFTSRE